MSEKNEERYTISHFLQCSVSKDFNRCVVRVKWEEGDITTENLFQLAEDLQGSYYYHALHFLVHKSIKWIPSKLMANTPSSYRKIVKKLLYKIPRRKRVKINQGEIKDFDVEILDAAALLIQMSSN